MGVKIVGSKSLRPVYRSLIVRYITLETHIRYIYLRVAVGLIKLELVLMRWSAREKRRAKTAVH